MNGLMQISGVVQVPSNNNRLKLTNQRRKAEDMLTNDEEGNKSHFVHNPNIERESPDYLYHLGLDTVTTDMVKTFSDVKVCKHQHLILHNRHQTAMNSGLLILCCV
jgi:hypothetical protein